MSMKRETYRYIDTNHREKLRWLEILTMQDGTKLADFHYPNGKSSRPHGLVIVASIQMTLLFNCRGSGHQLKTHRLRKEPPIHLGSYVMDYVERWRGDGVEMWRLGCTCHDLALEDGHFVDLEGVLKKTNARGEPRVKDMSVTFSCWHDRVTVDKLKKRFCTVAMDLRNFTISPRKFFIVKVDGMKLHDDESIMQHTRCGEQLVVKWYDETRHVETSPIVLPDRAVDEGSWELI